MEHRPQWNSCSIPRCVVGLVTWPNTTTIKQTLVTWLHIVAIKSSTDNRARHACEYNTNRGTNNYVIVGVGLNEVGARDRVVLHVLAPPTHHVVIKRASSCQWVRWQELVLQMWLSLLDLRSSWVSGSYACILVVLFLALYIYGVQQRESGWILHALLVLY